jgi:hypothetical protein
MAIVTRSMKDRDDGDEFSLDSINDSIRKSGWQEPADIAAAVPETLS